LIGISEFPNFNQSQPPDISKNWMEKQKSLIEKLISNPIVQTPAWLEKYFGPVNK
jgi:hypothetical protein